MGAKGKQTRERILEVAERLILQRGFAGTAIEDIIKEAAISKGGFFYHFDGKNDLAISLLERYREEDALLFSGMFARAEELSDDPLQQMLIFLKLLSETMAELEELHPGCLVASFTYESQQVNEQVRALTAECVLDWRRLFQRQIDKVNQRYQAATDVTSEALADMLSSIIEGGIVVSRALGNPDILVSQLLQYRSHVSLLYQQVT
jgi:AcrR family transcriptional regulator